MRSLIEPRDLTVVVNTGDDEVFFGLHVSPDIDTILYTLADLADAAQGWGRRGDSYRGLGELARFYPDAWFRLGDLDLATHVYRTDRLRCGDSLSTITAALARSLGVEARIVPMTDAPVRTFVTVAGKGALAFQQYLVRDHAAGTVERIVARGAARAEPAEGVVDAITGADAIVLPPSNPFVSIGPILAVRGVRAALRAAGAPVVAISPLIGARPVKGPLHRMLSGLGHEVSALGVARLYRGLADIFVIDRQDATLAPAIAKLGMTPLVTDTLMSNAAKSRRLARQVLAAAAIPR
ncbi:MAG TPA: 2-phospho-L-lactate transferase [Terriglobales bacterium]|nr:2-phospho-L-lactate transferase [Terriglobales bacterium]